MISQLLTPKIDFGGQVLCLIEERSVTRMLSIKECFGVGHELFWLLSVYAGSTSVGNNLKTDLTRDVRFLERYNSG